MNMHAAQVFLPVYVAKVSQELLSKPILKGNLCKLHSKINHKIDYNPRLINNSRDILSCDNFCNASSNSQQYLECMQALLSTKSFSVQ